MENNMKTRVTEDMNFAQALVAMSDENAGAITCILRLAESNPEKGMQDICLLDSLGIYGSKIHTLWKDCCKYEITLLKKTIAAFHAGKISREQIHANLNHFNPKPFLYLELQ